MNLLHDKREEVSRLVLKPNLHRVFQKNPKDLLIWKKIIFMRVFLNLASCFS